MEILFNYIRDYIYILIEGTKALGGFFLNPEKFDDIMRFMTYGGGWRVFLEGMLKGMR